MLQPGVQPLTARTWAQLLRVSRHWLGNRTPHMCEELQLQLHVQLQLQLHVQLQLQLQSAT